MYSVNGFGSLPTEPLGGHRLPSMNHKPEQIGPIQNSDLFRFRENRNPENVPIGWNESLLNAKGPLP